MSSNGKVTQAAIAMDLGLSQSLVSRVLNGIRQKTDPETYDRIWARAVELGYRGKGLTPHAPLTAAGGRQIGLILRAGLKPFAQSTFFSHVLAGIHRVLQLQGFSTVVIGSEDTVDPAAAGPLPPALVVLGAVKPSFLRNLRRHTRRIVAINGSYPGLCHSVLPNESQSLQLLAGHLASLGHRHVGWIGGAPQQPIYSTRLDALRVALATHHLPRLSRDACVVCEQSADRQQGREAALELLRRRGKRPTALLCFNGVMARGAVNAFLQSGMKIPRDLSIVAVDATRVCVEEQPHITCASADPEKLGGAAAHLLLSSTGSDDETYQNLVIAAQFHSGETTGPAA